MVFVMTIILTDVVLDHKLIIKLQLTNITNGIAFTLPFYSMRLYLKVKNDGLHDECMSLQVELVYICVSEIVFF